MSSDIVKFDAKKYLVAVRSGSKPDYLPVSARLLWLRSEHPDAIVETKHVSISQEEAVFMARITIPGGGSATAYGTEKAREFKDFVEKAETKSIGRALKHLGYGTEFTNDDGEIEANSAISRQSYGGNNYNVSNKTGNNYRRV